MIAAAAPTRVRARLAAASGPVRFLHRGPVAVYLEVDGWCVGVVGTAAVAVPCALRLATPGVGDLAGAESAAVVDGVLHLDGQPVVIGRTLDVSVPRLGPSASRGPLASPQADDLDADAVPLLVGRGSGLTPAGDDVLCGWFAIHHAAGVGVPEVERAVADLLWRTTTLSATLLDCAMHGEVIPEFARLVRALDEPADLPAAVDALVAVGHTSGRALLAGAELALGSLGIPLGTEQGRCA